VRAINSEARHKTGEPPVPWVNQSIWIKVPPRLSVGTCASEDGLLYLPPALESQRGTEPISCVHSLRAVTLPCSQ
jgi:hypothetical protein